MVVAKEVPTIFWETETVSQNILKHWAWDISHILDCLALKATNNVFKYLALFSVLLLLVVANGLVLVLMYDKKYSKERNLQMMLFFG